MTGKRDEQIRKFADAVSRGAVVWCSPSIFDAIHANSEYVSKFAGCEIRKALWCQSDTLYAVMPNEDRRQLSVLRPSPKENTE